MSLQPSWGGQSVILSGVTAELIFVRHGESTFNRDRRWQGQSQDALLSDLGWRQAECAAQALADSGKRRIVRGQAGRPLKQAVNDVAEKSEPDPDLFNAGGVS